MLATLADVKSYLSISDTTQDTLLTSLLTSADAFVKSFTGRDFEQKTYTHLFNWKWENKLILKQYPVISLTSFKYNTGSFSVPNYVSFYIDTYKVDPEVWQIWTMFNIPKWIQNIQVIYSAWYVNIPEEIKQAVIKLTATYFNWSKTDWLVSESIDWASLTYEKNSIPTDILLILNRYKNVQVF